MLSDEQLKALPDWIAPIAVDFDWRCRHEQYAVGRDVSHEAQQLRIIVELANTLLTLKEAWQMLRGLEWTEDSEYAVWFCPKCNSDMPEHADGCELAKILAEA